MSVYDSLAAKRYPTVDACIKAIKRHLTDARIVSSGSGLTHVSLIGTREQVREFEPRWYWSPSPAGATEALYETPLTIRLDGSDGKLYKI